MTLCIAPSVTPTTWHTQLSLMLHVILCRCRFGCCDCQELEPLSYAKAKGKYGATEEKGIYPEVSDCCAYDMIILHTHHVRLSTDCSV